MLDVCVDLRSGSVTWGCWKGALHLLENQRQLVLLSSLVYRFLVPSKGGSELLQLRCGGPRR
ncbi:MAG: hypothetical protein IKF14_04650 [Atopobiaceae bacterium]|nr:hypothetical protein [Atopobiaceae bacterium]